MYQNKLWHLAVLASFCFISTCLQAAQLPGDRDLARERQQRLLQEQQQRLDELQSLPGALPGPSVDSQTADGHCIAVQRIELLGVTRLVHSAQSRLLHSYQHQCLTAARLNLLLQDITHAYLERGYVTTRAYLPAQDLASGTLQVQVVEGHTEGLDGADVLSPHELRMLVPLNPGQPFNIRNLEQAVDQLGRLPSRQVQFDLQQSSAQP